MLRRDDTAHRPGVAQESCPRGCTRDRHERSVILTETEQKPIISPRWVPFAILKSTLAQVPVGQPKLRHEHVLALVLRVFKVAEMAWERVS
jgi:hypothetical protein